MVAVAWNQGPELLMMMIDYYDHTGDRDFLERQLKPAAAEILRYFETRFKKDAAGRLLISPTQAIETYWEGVTNDTPTLSGLIAVLARLLALPPATLPSGLRASWQALNDSLPDLPSGKTMELPFSGRLRRMRKNAATWKIRKSMPSIHSVFSAWVNPTC